MCVLGGPTVCTCVHTLDKEVPGSIHVLIIRSGNGCGCLAYVINTSKRVLGLPKDVNIAKEKHLKYRLILRIRVICDVR